MNHRRGFVLATGALALGVSPVLWLAANLSESSTPTDVFVPVARGGPANDARADAAPAAAATPRRASAKASRAELVDLAERDPIELVRRGHAWYEQNVRSYRCTLVKQELLGKKLTPVQEIELRYREQPRAIYMIWKANADQARRALYLDQPEYVDKKGRLLARVEPNGAVARVFTKDIFMPVDGPDARKCSRRSITDAGFHSTFELFENYHATASARGVVKLKYAGVGTVDGRPTFVLERTLPYDGPTGPYPDARLIMHLDQEWLLPVAVYSYADDREKDLLGSYVFTKIELNPPFDAVSFEF